MSGNERTARGRSGADAALIAALAAGRTQAEAAELAGVSERTVRRRLEGAPFRRAVARQRAASLERAAGVLAAMIDEAAATLRAVMADPDAPASSRVAAARTVLLLGQDLHERAGLEERIAALEEAAERAA